MSYEKEKDTTSTLLRCYIKNNENPIDEVEFKPSVLPPLISPQTIQRRKPPPCEDLTKDTSTVITSQSSKRVSHTDDLKENMHNDEAVDDENQTAYRNQAAGSLTNVYALFGIQRFNNMYLDETR